MPCVLSMASECMHRMCFSFFGGVGGGGTSRTHWVKTSINQAIIIEGKDNSIGWRPCFSDFSSTWTYSWNFGQIYLWFTLFPVPMLILNKLQNLNNTLLRIWQSCLSRLILYELVEMIYTFFFWVIIHFLSLVSTTKKTSCQNSHFNNKQRVR